MVIGFMCKKCNLYNDQNDSSILLRISMTIMTYYKELLKHLKGERGWETIVDLLWRSSNIEFGLFKCTISLKEKNKL